MSEPVLGFIGLGVMGGGMCANVASKHAAPVHAFDMNPEALDAAVVSSSFAMMRASSRPRGRPRSRACQGRP